MREGETPFRHAEEIDAIPFSSVGLIDSKTYPFFDNEFETEINELRGYHFMNERKVIGILHELSSEGRLPTVYRQITESLLQGDISYAFVKELDLGLKDDIINLKPKNSDVTVQWGIQFVKPYVQGLYFQDERKIQLRGKKPTPGNMVLSLATRGKLPKTFSLYAHEMVHDQQDYYLDNQGNLLMVPYNLTPELREAQAYLVSHSDKSNEDLIQSILYTKEEDGTLYYADMDSNKLKSALEAFRFFNNTFISQKGIADLVRRPGAWDEEKGEYTEIAKAMDMVSDKLKTKPIWSSKTAELRNQYLKFKIMHDTQELLKAYTRERS